MGHEWHGSLWAETTSKGHLSEGLLLPPHFLEPGKGKGDHNRGGEGTRDFKQEQFETLKKKENPRSKIIFSRFGNYV